MTERADDPHAHGKIDAPGQEPADLRQAWLRAEHKASVLAAELRLIKGSRFWRLRKLLMAAVNRVSGMAKRHAAATTPTAIEHPADNSDSQGVDCDGNEPTWQFADHDLPPVAVIIVNYNGLDHLPGCLESLQATEYPNFQVTLVDNGSSDESVEWVRSHHPEVQVICSPENLGFGKANHLGIRHSDAPIIALLNNDTVVEPQWLRALVEPLLADESLAATSSKLRFLDNPRILNGVGGSMNRLGLAFDWGINEVDRGQLDSPREVLFPCGAACAMRRSAFEAAGGFDSAFFMYHEDVDLGWRLRLLGYSIRTAPRSIVYHSFGGTTRRLDSEHFREQLGLRHDLRSLIKNYQLTSLCWILPLFMLFLGLASWRCRSLRFLSCLGWNLKHLPDTLRQRWAIQRTRRVSDRELKSLIYQGRGVPCLGIDYTPVSYAGFLNSDCRRSWVKLAACRLNNLGYGWHPAEQFFDGSRIKCRWSGQDAAAYLWNHYGRGTLDMEVTGCAALVGRPRAFCVSINGRPAARFELCTDDWTTVSVPYRGEPGPLEITIHAEDIWLPDEVFRNGDKRQLGIAVRQMYFKPFVENPIAWDGISVIIPTYNRCQKLLRVLRSLESQTLDASRFEVIVIDDGSTDDTLTKLAQYAETSPMRLRFASQTNKLQGAARNFGITLAKEPLVLFIGDDIIPSPDFLKQHFEFHRKHNTNGDVAVVGQIRWDKELRITPFMQFINDCGAQFGFAFMTDSGPWQFDCFYTSNVSLPRRLLEKLPYVFDEDFKTYGWEDTELAYRLERSGVRLLYDADALAEHDHPTSVRQFCLRQYQVGRCSRLFASKHPELESHLGDLAILSSRAKAAGFLKPFVWVADILDRRLGWRLKNRWYWAFLNINYARGVVDAIADMTPASGIAGQLNIHSSVDAASPDRVEDSSEMAA